MLQLVLSHIVWRDALLWTSDVLVSLLLAVITVTVSAGTLLQTSCTTF